MRWCKEEKVTLRSSLCFLRTCRPSSGWLTVKAGTPSWSSSSEMNDATGGAYKEYLVDSTLLPCDFRECLSEDGCVVDSKRRDSGDYRTRDDVRAIICSAYSDFQNGGIDLIHTSILQSYR